MSQDIFECNLKAMEKWYPAFAEEVLKAECVLAEDVEVIKHTSMDGELIYRIKRNEQLLYLNGKWNAKQPVNVWAEQLGEIHKYAPVFLLGIGSGAYFKKLIEKTDESVSVIVYEPSLKIFLETLKEIDLSEELESRPVIFSVKGLNESVFAPVLSQTLSDENMAFLKVEIHPNYEQLFLEDIVEKMKEIKKRILEITVRHNSNIQFSTYVVRNQMKNLRYICDGYHTRCLVKTVPYSGPAVLVSAGPSLNKNIEELRAAKNRAFILAVDTAVKPLIKAGIYPDAICTIDPMKPLDLLNLKESEYIPIIAPATANYELIEHQKGKKIFYNDGHIIAPRIYWCVGKSLPMVSTGGSVACSAFSLLYKLGFDTIILMGQDLAFTGNRSHADGTFKEVMPEEDTRGMLQIKGNYEDKVPTVTNLKMYLEWFEMSIKGMKGKRKKFRVINATAGGAYIEGTELMSLKDAIDLTCGEEINFEECLEKIEPDLTQEDHVKIMEYLQAIPKELEKLKLDAKELYSVYYKINQKCSSGSVNQNVYLKLLGKIKKITKKCEGNPWYQLVSSTMALAEYIVRTESLYSLDTIEEEGKAISKQGMKFAELLQQSADIVCSFTNEILQEME